MLSNAASSTIFWVFGMTQPGIEPRSPGPLANTLLWFGLAYQLLWVIHIYPTPPLEQDMTRGQFFKRNLTGLNSEFSFSLTGCLTKDEEPSLPYYLTIAGGRIIGFIPSPRVLVLCEMQSVSARIWTRDAVSISYDDNHYTTSQLVGYLKPNSVFTNISNKWFINTFCWYIYFNDLIILISNNSI